jgi:hypothetical protein
MLRATVDPTAVALVTAPKKLYELKYVDVGIAALISGFAFSLGAALFTLAKAKATRKR